VRLSRIPVDPRLWLGVLTLALVPLRPAAAAESIRIVVLPIVVHSAAPDTAFVSRGIADMISSRLEQTGRIQVERVEDAGAGTTELGEAWRLGRKRGGDYLVFGAFTQFGDGASLDVQCIPLDVATEAEAAAARRIFIQSGSVGEIIPKLDEIVDRVAIYVRAVPGELERPGPGAPAAAPADAQALRALADRIEALEKAVFSGDGTAARAPEAPPES
jgi:TolB-like protein